jgi:putative chitinase
MLLTGRSDEDAMNLRPEVLRFISPNGHDDIMVALAKSWTIYFPVFEINTLFRAAHFLGQVAHESAGFQTLHEYWGPTEAQLGYEGRDDLGNTQAGDGHRFMGRGPMQLTGRDNYTKMAARLNLDLVNKPELAAEPDVAAHIACLFWTDKGLNSWADEDNVKAITRRINGGFNGLASRMKYVVRAKSALKQFN